MKKFIITFLSLFFIALIAYSGYQLWKINEDYASESKIHDMVLKYKPNGEIINQSVIDLQEKYPDVVGWLTVPNTKIDYPFVQAKDNDYYLRRDINGNYAFAGTLFMDSRNKKDFSDFNTVIYGHHMQNDSMFGSLKKFNNKAFFDENRTGTIYLPNDTLVLEFFAYIVVKPNDQVIYNTGLSETYFDYVKQKARYFRDIEITDGDKILTLSTCSYEFNNARMVMLAKIIK